jgi:hypothetical protein
MRSLATLLPRSFPDPRYGTLLVVFISILALFIGFLPLLGVHPNDASSQLESQMEKAQNALNDTLTGKTLHTSTIPTQFFEVQESWLVAYTQRAAVRFQCKQDETNTAPASPPAKSPVSAATTAPPPPPPPPPPPVLESGDGTDQLTPLPDKECTISYAYMEVTPPRRVLRWDRLIYVTTTAILAGLGFFYLRRMSADRRQRPISHRGKGDGIDTTSDAIAKRHGDNSLSFGPLETHMMADVQKAFDRADALFVRSSFMLVAGILTAVVGVTVFAFLTSSTASMQHQRELYYSAEFRGPWYQRVNTDQLSAEQKVEFAKSAKEAMAETRKSDIDETFLGIVTSAASNFRYVIIFIFMETIAWFLLRQYRALIEDYKYFYRIYLKRLNYLNSYSMLKGRNLSEAAETLVSASMLQEDLSGRMRKGEELESSAQMQYAEHSFSSIADFIERLSDIAQKAIGSRKEDTAGPSHPASERTEKTTGTRKEDTAGPSHPASERTEKTTGTRKEDTAGPSHPASERTETQGSGA